MRWSDIIGQEGAVCLLRRALGAGRLSQALLFSGPAGVGKRTTARTLAAALLCPARGLADEACGTCPSCLLSRCGGHPDFHVPLAVERGDRKKRVEDWAPARAVSDEDRQIAVDTVRYLMHQVGLRSSSGGPKVALIPRAERMNESAQNALLKGLEEPPGGLVWILTSEDPTGLLPTVRSRAMRVRFGRIPTGALASALTGAAGGATARSDAVALAEAAEGSFLRAEALRSEDWTAERAHLEKTAMPHVGAGRGAGPALAEALIARLAAVSKSAPKAETEGLEGTRRPALRMLEVLARLVRDRMRESLAAGPSAACEWARRLEVVLASDAAIRQNVRAELALAVAAARLARPW